MAISLDEWLGPEAGGKALTLARLRAAGVRVLPGLVLLPGDLAPSVDALRALGPRLVVRSSSVAEDRAGRSAAGVFLSEVGVAPEDVAAAVARVRASAVSDGARAYGVGDLPLAVLIQPVCAADWLAMARRRSDGSVLVERRRPGEPEWGRVEAREGPELVALFAEVEAVLGAPVDLELATLDKVWTVLQARPSPPPIPQPIWNAPGPGRWRLDAEHNPAPLSEAQAGLVAAVHGAGPLQAVVQGWLYYREEPPLEAPLVLANLRQIFDEELVPDCLRVLAAVDQGSLPSVLAAYRHVYRRYVDELSPTLRAARRQLDDLLRAELGEGLASHAALLGGTGGLTVERDELLWRLGAGQLVAGELLRFAAYAPAWDVAAPTDGEDPERLRQLAAAFVGRPSPLALQRQATATADTAREQIAARVGVEARPRFLTLLPLVREACVVAEDDDRLFFEAQWTVRRALLRRGQALVAAGQLSSVDEIFCLSLEDDAPTPEKVGAAQRRQRANQRVRPPDSFDDGVARFAPVAGTALRGQPTFGAARGRALVLGPLRQPPAIIPAGTILVVAALLPSLGPLLPSLAALVTEHGGVMSHGATLAREYALPAVLGVPGATQIPDGAELFVDGQRGLVLVL